MYIMYEYIGMSGLNGNEISVMLKNPQMRIYFREKETKRITNTIF